MYKKQIQNLALPIFQYLKKEEKRKAEEELILLLKKTLKRHHEKPNKGTPLSKEDYLLIQFLCFGFDKYFQTQFFLDKKHQSAVSGNKHLLSCCRNPKLMEFILFQILNYLLWNEPYYFSQRELLSAIEDYKNKGNTNMFKGSTSRHDLKGNQR